MIINNTDRTPDQKGLWRERCSRNLSIARDFWQKYLHEDEPHLLEITFIYFHNYLISKYRLCCLENDGQDIDKKYEMRLGGIFLSKNSDTFTNPYYSEIKKVFKEEEFRNQVDSIVNAYTTPEESFNDRIWDGIDTIKEGRKKFKRHWDNCDGDYIDFSYFHARCRNHLLHGFKPAEDLRNLKIVKSFCIVLDLYISKMEDKPSIYMDYMKMKKN